MDRIPFGRKGKRCSEGAFTLQFSDNFYDYRKIWFYVNGLIIIL